MVDFALSIINLREAVGEVNASNPHKPAAIVRRDRVKKLDKIFIGLLKFNGYNRQGEGPKGGVGRSPVIGLIFGMLS